MLQRIQAAKNWLSGGQASSLQRPRRGGGLAKEWIEKIDCLYSSRLKMKNEMMKYVQFSSFFNEKEGTFSQDIFESRQFLKFSHTR